MTQPATHPRSCQRRRENEPPVERCSTTLAAAARCNAKRVAGALENVTQAKLHSRYELWDAYPIRARRDLRIRSKPHSIGHARDPGSRMECVPSLFLHGSFLLEQFYSHELGCSGAADY